MPPFGLRLRSEERAQPPLSAGRSAHGNLKTLESGSYAAAAQIRFARSRQHFFTDYLHLADEWGLWDPYLYGMLLTTP